MAARKVTTLANNLLLGVCLPCLKHDASRIRVQNLELDKKLLTFFKKYYVFYAFDPEKLCRTGDIVLIEKLEKQMSTSITHKVLEVVYSYGDVVDPITGKSVISSFYRDQLDVVSSNFGELKTKFQYHKAPKRGWQEDRKDFSHRESYLKYHEFDENDENKFQPYSRSYQ